MRFSKGGTPKIWNLVLGSTNKSSEMVFYGSFMLKSWSKCGWFENCQEEWKDEKF